MAEVIIMSFIPYKRSVVLITSYMMGRPYALTIFSQTDIT